jgi:hypothetical protein
MYFKKFFQLFKTTFILLCSVLCSLSYAGDRVSFVLGIDNYDNFPPYKQLTRSVKDAKTLAALLEDIHFKVCSKKNSSYFQFIDEWDNFIKTIKKGDEVVLFFSGHGIEIDGSNYLLARDTPFVQHGRQEKLKRRSISISEILADIITIEPKITILILDACRENPFIPPEYKGEPEGSGLAPMPSPPEGVIIMYSAAEKQASLDRLPGIDENPNSVYMRQLLPLLKQPNLRIQEVARKVMEEVVKETKAIGHYQRPSYYDSIIGAYCLHGDKCSPSYGNLSEYEMLEEISKLRKIIDQMKIKGEAFSVDSKVIKSLDNQKIEVILIAVAENQYRLEKEFSYIDEKGIVWTVPKGFIFEGTAIPKNYWSFIGSPFDPEYQLANILLEFYAERRERSFKDTYRMFYEVLIASGVSVVKAKLLYSAVYNFGPRWTYIQKK